MIEVFDSNGVQIHVGDLVEPDTEYSWWCSDAKGEDRFGVVKEISENPYGSPFVRVSHACTDVLTHWGGVPKKNGKDDVGVHVIECSHVTIPPVKGAREIDERFVRRAAEREKRYTEADLKLARDEGYELGHNHGYSEGHADGYDESRYSNYYYSY